MVLLVIGGLALRLAPMFSEGWELLTSIVCATVFLVGVEGRLRSSEVWLRLNTRFLRAFACLLCGQSGPLWFGELQILRFFQTKLVKKSANNLSVVTLQNVNSIAL